jgi:hypothetical protein
MKEKKPMTKGVVLDRAWGSRKRSIMRKKEEGGPERVSSKTY